MGNCDKIEDASRPYAFIKFDTFIEKMNKQYVDSRNTSNLSKMNEDLRDITEVMQQSIQDLLAREGKLTSVLDKATQLRYGSSKHLTNAKRLNTHEMLRKCGPVAFVFFM